MSRRLLILSAGVYSNPGDLLPMKLVTAAKRQGIDMSDERPCAAFEVSDRKLPLPSSTRGWHSIVAHNKAIVVDKVMIPSSLVS